jgi:hypothetical protein
MTRKEKARNIFFGLNGEKKLNCAQTIIASNVQKDMKNIDLFAGYGGGQAPNGLCGAYYAVCYLHPEKITDFEKYFMKEVGFLKCKELKQNKISCLVCVEKAAEFLDKD